jgi:hypothetical protein
MCVLEIIWEIFFCYFSSLFQNFFCVKGPDNGSSCPDGKVDSSGRSLSLSRRACFCDLLRGTSSERHLSSIGTVNPVGLYCIPPHRSLLISLFWSFLSSYAFCLCFLCVFLTYTCHLCNFSPPQVCFYTLLLIYFKF